MRWYLTSFYVRGVGGRRRRPQDGLSHCLDHEILLGDCLLLHSCWRRMLQALSHCPYHADHQHRIHNVYRQLIKIMAHPSDGGKRSVQSFSVPLIGILIYFPPDCMSSKLTLLAYLALNKQGKRTQKNKMLKINPQRGRYPAWYFNEHLVHTIWWHNKCWSHLDCL